MDDAVHIKRLPNGNFELGVHIADVSYYVTEGSALNREAVARGTSVYVTDRVVPMLPERLSNGICSLNPNVDRLTQSAIMEITPKGKVVNHKICQSVINTTFRMTYSDVNEMLAGNPEKIEQFKEDYMEQMLDETNGYPSKVYFNYTDDSKTTIDISSVTWRGIPAGESENDYDDNKSFWGSERNTSDPKQSQTNLPSISSGLIGDNVPVKNRYLLPIASTTISASNGVLSNSYGYSN